MTAKLPVPFDSPLRRAREEQGWSQAKLAEALGTNHFTVSRWERGVAVPSPYYRQRLAEVFALSLEALGLLPQQAAASEHQEQPATPGVSHGFAAAPGFTAFLPPRPSLAGGLVGREALLQRLKAQLLAREAQSVCALQGLPGVGKTSLALELAHDPEVQAHFQGGILWAGLGRIPHLFETFSRWGRALGLSPEESVRLTTLEAWADALRAAIGMRRCLLILDDVWRSEDALAALVGGPQCGTLLTTRFLHVALQVAGTAVTPVAELSEAEGLELLLRLAKEPMARESEAARRLVRAVGGLPLALTLMGKYLERQAYSGQPRRIQAALERLGQRRERLQLSQPQAPLERHPSLPFETPLSLEASIGLSVAALDAPAQAMLQALAVFPPKPTSFSEEAALAVAAGRAETLDTLVDAGLVESRGAGRYTLHQTIADSARLHGLPPEIAQRFIGWAVDWIGAHQEEDFALEQELHLLLAALHLASTADDLHPLLLQGSTKLSPFLLARGFYLIAEELLQQAQAAARLRADTDGLLTALLQLGALAEKRGDYLLATQHLQEGLHLARAQGDPLHQSAFLAALGVLLSHRGELAQAQEYLEEGLALAQHAESRATRARLLINLGALYADQGRLEQAERSYQEALHLAEALAQPRLVIGAWEGLAQVFIRRGDALQAQNAAQAAVALARQHGYRERLCGALTNLGVLALDQGQLEEAKTAFEEALHWAQNLGHREFTCRALINLSEVELRLGRLAEAKGTLEEALTLAWQLDHHHYRCHCLRLLGELRLHQGHLDQAEAAFQEGIAVARASAYRWVLSALLCGWGDLHLATAQWEGAIHAYAEALELAGEIKSQELEAASRYGLAQVAAAQGKWQEAQQHAQASLATFESIGYYKTTEVRQWLETLPQRWAPVSASESKTPGRNGSTLHS